MEGCVYLTGGLHAARPGVDVSRGEREGRTEGGKDVSEIKPALTPEEWANPAGRIDGWIDLDAGRIDVMLGGPASPTRDTGRDRHALAAVLLDGQPFGFTWEDVDTLRDIAINDVPELNEEGSAFNPEPELASIADRIAALLPPREIKP